MNRTEVDAFVKQISCEHTAYYVNLIFQYPNVLTYFIHRVSIGMI